jgi:hypothetical protein
MLIIIRFLPISRYDPHLVDGEMKVIAGAEELIFLAGD